VQRVEGKQNFYCSICSPRRPVARALRRYTSVFSSNPSLAWDGDAKLHSCFPAEAHHQPALGVKMFYLYRWWTICTLPGTQK